MIGRLLKAQADLAPEAIALTAPGRTALSYRSMIRQIESIIAQLHRSGVGRGDRVAIVLPNGPEMALTFLATVSGAVAAPLNPAYRSAEFEFYLSDLKPKALIVQSGTNSPARAVASALGATVLELSPLAGAEAGLFTLSGDQYPLQPRAGIVEEFEPALLLHTSGTTSRPKLVKLTQANLCAAADNIRTSLGLCAEDRCLSVMPLFHVHGLIGGLLSSLAAGASVVCSPGFDALRFFDWLDHFQPSWYTAVPTMHQALLTHACSYSSVIARRPLRFIRSCSAPLAPRLLHELELAFRAPVVEAYGMTEASHQMASNPLPPATRKPGSVGMATGLQIAIKDDAANFLPRGACGEVVIRGDSVTPGYEGNLPANEVSFIHGWFRTGDLGHIDEDGYLFLTGRIKEIINRGGEKISPREIDEVLLNHPAVSQALTFAVPHNSLGQDVAAAVVLRAQALLTEGELREFAAARLSPAKVPHQIYFLDDLPQSASGKLQRSSMAEKLGLLPGGRSTAKSALPEFVAPRTQVECRLAAIWSDLLGVERVGVNDNFAQLGGDSLLAAQLLAQIEQTMHVDVTGLDVFAAPTVAGMAEQIERLNDPVRVFRAARQII